MSDNRPSVTIISNNLSAGGSLGCATIGRALQRDFDVRITGPMFGKSLWPGLLELDFPVQPFPGREFPAYASDLWRATKTLDSDVIVAHQLRLSSFGIAAARKALSGTPVALYIDDDDLELTIPGRSNPLRKRLRQSNGDLYTRLMFRMRRRADITFCGSEYFTERFDGVTARLGRDASVYNPGQTDRDALRRELGVEDGGTVIGFVGNPREHVGIEDVVRGIELTADPRVMLIVIPAGEIGDYAKKLFAASRATVRVLENQPSSRVPAFLDASDLVAVPQRVGSVGAGQLPARLVEAMAMAKPIVTTSVSDIPGLLEGAAVFVGDRAPPEIAVGIEWIRDNPAEARAMGERAREVFLEQLSLDAMSRKLIPPLNELIARRRPRP